MATFDSDSPVHLFMCPECQSAQYRAIPADARRMMCLICKKWFAIRELRLMRVRPIGQEFCKLGDMNHTSLDIQEMIRKAKEERKKYTEGIE